MFEWDEAKAKSNVAKHGVDFGAVAAFDWNTAIVEPDTRRDYGEIRFTATGNLNGRCHVLTFTRRGSRLRIIGLRKANRREDKKWMIHRASRSTT